MVLTIDIFEYDLPKFGIVDKIYFCSNLVLFHCFKLNTIIIDEHYHAFEVEKVNNDYIYVC